MIPVQYRLMTIEFRNRLPENQRRIGFEKAILQHDAARKAVVLAGMKNSRVKTSDKNFNVLMELLSPYELLSIRYFIDAEGFPEIPFCHPFPNGAGVYLRAFEKDNPDALYLTRDGKKFFSNNFTLRDISAGKIDSSQSAFQFHE